MRIERGSFRRARARSLVAASAVAALALTACGGDDDEATTTDPPTETSGGSSAPGDSNSSTDPDGTGGSTAPEGTGESSELLATAQAEGIRIGIANERPYGYEENGEATGEAPELAREIFSRMDIDDVEFEVVEFGALINGLNASRYDVIAAGMFINAERAEQVLFADPDYCGTTAFGVPEGNPDDVGDFQSIIDNDVQLGVLAGAVEEGYALDTGVSDDQISAFQSTPDLFDALAAGRVDAAVLTAITVRAQVEGIDGFEATEGFVPEIDGEEQLGCGAFAFRYDDELFRDEFNDILLEMQENGEVLEIVEPFGFTDAEVDAAVGVTVDDLTAAS